MALPLSRGTTTGLAVLTSALTVGATAFVLTESASAAPAPASASVNQYDWLLTYQASPGQKNALTVAKEFTTEDGASVFKYRIDDQVPIDAGYRCEHPDESDQTVVVCTVLDVDMQSPYTDAIFNLGDKNDTARLTTPKELSYFSNAEFHLGAGNDTYVSDKKIEDTSGVDGGDGNDTITIGQPAGDQAGINGGRGNDTLRALVGTATINGNSGNDTITGTPGVDWLRGGPGRDLIHGGKGSDTIQGGPGNDKLYGQSGDDQVLGEAGDDWLSGGPGKDKLSGGPGKDVVKQ